MPILIDGRELQAPEPLEQTLAALDRLADGDEVTLLLNCQPHPLFSILRRNGYVWHEQTRDDGGFAYVIRQAPLPG